MLEGRNWRRLETELFDPLEGRELTDLESYVASLLLSASAARPIGIREIVTHTRLALEQEIDERKVKKVIRELRREHGFPILARRKRPSGYWWCETADEMESFVSSFRSQAMDELVTISKMVKLNYPEIAGQLRLEEE